MAVPARRVPYVIGARGEDDVAHVPRAELPGQRSARLRPRGTALQLRLGDDAHRLIRLCRLCEPCDCGWRQHLVRVLQSPGRGDDVASRHGDLERVVAVLEVELALSEVWLGIEAAEIVVDRNAGIPLRDLIQRPITTHAVGAVLRNVEVPRDVERRGLTRRQRGGQVDTGHGLVVPKRERLAHRFRRRAAHLIEMFDDVSALEIQRPETRRRREDVRVERPRLERVLLGLEPDIAEETCSRRESTAEQR